MRFFCRPRSSVVEHFLGKEEVIGSIPIVGSIFRGCFYWLEAIFSLSRKLEKERFFIYVWLEKYKHHNTGLILQGRTSDGEGKI